MTNQIPPNEGKTKQHTVKSVEPLTDEFFDDLVAELDSDEIIGIILGGSYARNEATPFSDVDIACFVPDSLKPTPKRFIYRDGRLLSIREQKRLFLLYPAFVVYSWTKMDSLVD